MEVMYRVKLLVPLAPEAGGTRHSVPPRWITLQSKAPPKGPRREDPEMLDKELVQPHLEGDILHDGALQKMGVPLVEVTEDSHPKQMT